MKTTQEQRDAWKMKRRFSGWRDLLAKMHRRCRHSQRTLEIGYKTIKSEKLQQCASELQYSIWAAN